MAKEIVKRTEKRNEGKFYRYILNKSKIFVFLPSLLEQEYNLHLNNYE